MLGGRCLIAYSVQQNAVPVPQSRRNCKLSRSGTQARHTQASLSRILFMAVFIDCAKTQRRMSQRRKPDTGM